MKSLLQIAKDENWAEQRWIVVGKGPTFDRLFDGDFSNHWLFCLNHTIDAVRRMDVKYDTKKCVAHLIDVEVLDDCPEALLSAACRYVVMPLIPNQAMHRSKESLSWWVEKHWCLKRVDPKLLYYPRNSVDVRYFSVEAAFDLLGQIGVKHIQTVGIDGGTEHHGAFPDKALANGRASFDIQFERLTEIAAKHNLTWERLKCQTPSSP